MRQKERRKSSLGIYYKDLSNLIAGNDHAFDYKRLENGFFTEDKDLSLYLLNGEKSHFQNPIKNSKRIYPLFSDRLISDIITFFDTAIWIVERRLPIQSYTRAITQNFELHRDLSSEFIIALALLNNLEFSKIQSQYHIDGTSHLIEVTRQKSRLVCDIQDRKTFNEIIDQCNRSIDDAETAAYVERLIVTGHDHILNTLHLYSNLNQYVIYIEQGSNDNSIGKLLGIRKCDIKRLRQYANIEKLLIDDNRSARSRKLKSDIEQILDSKCYEWVNNISNVKGISEHSALKLIISEHKKITTELTPSQ
ncbi:hypothetical protein [Acinetobacter sp. Marseille-Q1618]|uniref:hypothetical protein n=1 Tax=Acinetobacter sp. Marseille-Q1618 TaxID=2697502 RepID=UPI00156F01E5|nr:hypothetical protein [Acinetobacter sp. Marseille-Q1618]